MASRKDTRAPLKTETCVLVTNIPLETREESFWKSLPVQRVGLVVSRRMIADPRGLPYQAAIIEYATVRLAECARNIFRIKFRHKILEVCCAPEFLEWFSTYLMGKSTNVDVSLLNLVEVDCLAPSISDEDIEKIFSPYAKVSNITKKSPPDDKSILRIILELEGLYEGLKAELSLDNTMVSGSKLSVRTAINLSRTRSIIRHEEYYSIVPDSELQYPQILFFKEFSRFERMERRDEMRQETKPAKAEKDSDQPQDNIHSACDFGGSSEEAPLLKCDKHSKAEKPVADAGLARRSEPQNESTDLPDEIKVLDYVMPKRIPFRGFILPAEREPTPLSQGAAALFQFIKGTLPVFEKTIRVPDDGNLEFSRIPDELKWIKFRAEWET